MVAVPTGRGRRHAPYRHLDRHLPCLLEEQRQRKPFTVRQLARQLEEHHVVAARLKADALICRHRHPAADFTHFHHAIHMGVLVNLRLAGDRRSCPKQTVRSVTAIMQLEVSGGRRRGRRDGARPGVFHMQGLGVGPQGRSAQRGTQQGAMDNSHVGNP